jgi:D-glycero-D-manno-heptose 1,7-bisphosphate phosphatase
MKKAEGRRRAVFLDRDGTINVERDYLHRIEDFAFIPGVPQAIRRLNEAGFLVLVVTNQSGVARGFFTKADVDALHRHLAVSLAEVGAFIDGYYVCPHHPTAGQGTLQKECSCRKGEPGLLLQGAVEHDIDLARSFMVGDKAADLMAGQRAGCTPLLVLTGYGRETAANPEFPNVPRFPSLAEAVEYILKGVNHD